MARTDETLVATVIETSLTSEQINAFIDSASLWVDGNLVGRGLSASLLAEIEKYLACHLITLRDPRLSSTKVSDVAETYQRDTQITEYLKAAAALDPTGRVREDFMTPANTRRFSALAGTGYDS